MVLRPHSPGRNTHRETEALAKGKYEVKQASGATPVCRGGAPGPARCGHLTAWLGFPPTEPQKAFRASKNAKRTTQASPKGGRRESELVGGGGKVGQVQRGLTV